MTTLLAQAGGAGGAPLADLIGGAIVGGAICLIVLAIGGLHRKRKIRWVRGPAPPPPSPGRVSAPPRWPPLPAAIGGGALQLALFGFWWDVATHIDNGRDNGPFGTPAHWPILIGLFGIALAGYLAVVRGADDDEPTAIKLRGGWSVPLGGLMLLACGAFALSGFPLDDTWHRVFGQDVTLWGPTTTRMFGSSSVPTITACPFLLGGRRSPPCT